MNTIRTFPLTAVHRGLFPFASLCVALASSLFGQDPAPTPVVQYAPSQVLVQGTYPFTTSYTFILTSPANYVPDNGATNITFRVDPTTDLARNAGSSVVITVSPIAPITGGAQARTVTVTMDVKSTASPTAGGQLYAYKIYAEGWTGNPVNNGHEINASMTAASTPLQPPVVTITSPAKGSVIVVDSLSDPIPFDFTVSPPATNPSPLVSITYSLEAGNAGAITLPLLTIPDYFLNGVLHQGETATQPTGIGTTNGAGHGTLTVTSAGSHTVSVNATNLGGTGSDANTFTVLLKGPPVIVTQPVSMLRLEGESAVFSPTIAGYPEPTFQWSKNGTPIPGATSASLAMSSVTTGDAGTYTVTATNTNNGITTSVTSTTATLGVVTSPTDQSVVAGQNASFAITTANVPGASYKWFRKTPLALSFSEVADLAPYSNSTTALLKITGATQAMDTDQFRCVVSNGVDSVTTNPARLFVSAPTPSTVTLSGTVFLDTNTNGLREGHEVGLFGISVTIQGTTSTGTAVATSTTSAANGFYSFNLAPGTYTVDAIELTGMTPTVLTVSRSVVSNVTGVNLGMYFNFSKLRGLKGDGLSQGYWSSNISKNLSVKPNGTQETLLNLQKYTDKIALRAPYLGLTLPAALFIFNSGDQLRLQTLAAEYNYTSGRLINGGQTLADRQALTLAFVSWAEGVLNNPTAYSAAYKTFVKDWMDAFDNSHGGFIAGPLP